MKQSIRVHILKASGRLSPFLHGIEKCIATAIKKTREKLPIENVDIVVYDGIIDVTAGFCHSARTLNPYTVKITLDPKFPNFEKALEKELPSTISHELYHTVRWKKIDVGETLLEAIIFEGLASRFEQEVWGGKPPAWVRALSSRELLRIMKVAKQEFYNAKYNYHRWFFGTGKFPRWTGYSLGYFLVSEYIKKHPTQTAATLVGKPANTFIE